MKKLFVRIQDEVDSLELGHRSEMTKKELNAMKKYAYMSVQRTNKDAADKYIVKDFNTFLRTLISLANKLDASPSELTMSEQEQIFQILALSCAQPKLFFSRNTLNSANASKESPVKDFDKQLGKFYKKWAAFQKEINACERYIHRGTTDLDRRPLKDRLGEKKEGLEKLLDTIYKAYYYNLKEYVPDLPLCNDKPKTDTNLLNHCYEKPWLLPLAHVILIRDAQCQMLGIQKYKKADLLIRNQKSGVRFFGQDELPDNQKRACNAITYSFARKIQKVLSSILKENYKSNCKDVFSRLYYKEYKERMEQNAQRRERDPIWSRFTDWASIFETQEYMMKLDTLKPMDMAPFSIPNCHTEILAWRIATKLELSNDQRCTLADGLPEFLGTRIGLENWLHKYFAGTDMDPIKNDLKTILNAIKRLVSPDEYYSEGKDEDKLRKELQSAAKILDIKFKKTNPSQSDLWHVFDDMIFFQDLTRPALVLSGAINIENCPKDMLFGVLDYFRSELDDQLECYTKSKYKRKVLGIDQLDKDKLTVFRMDPTYEKPKCAIFRQLVEKENMDDLTLDDIDRFLRNPMFSVKMGDPQQSSAERTVQGPSPVENIVNEAIKRVGSTDPVAAKMLETLSAEDHKYICWIVFSDIIDCSVAIIKKKTMSALLKMSFEFVRSTDREIEGNAVKGGESQ